MHKKPKPQAPKPQEKALKPAYIRKPHLTDRPFKDHEGLTALQRSMQNHPSNHKRN